MTILKLKIDSGMRDGELVMQRCSQLFHRYLRHDLASLKVPTCSPMLPNQQIGRMVLDLGELPAARWEEVLRERLLERLSCEFRSLMGDAVHAVFPSLDDAVVVGREKLVIQRSSGEGVQWLERMLSDDGGAATRMGQARQIPSSDARLSGAKLERLLGVIRGANFDVFCALARDCVSAPSLAKLVQRFPRAVLEQICSSLAEEELSLPISNLSHALRDSGAKFLACNPQAKPQQRVADAKAKESENEGQPLANAGLVLLWPLLTKMLRQFRCVDSDSFLDKDARYRAAHSLNRLVERRAVGAEARNSMVPQTVSVLLCGLPLDDVMLDSDDALEGRVLEADLIAMLDHWRDSLPTRLSGLERLSPSDICELFLQRPGTLTIEGGISTVHVEPDASDILLRNVPWPMNQVMLPWLDNPLRIDWL